MWYSCWAVQGGVKDGRDLDEETDQEKLLLEEGPLAQWFLLWQILLDLLLHKHILCLGMYNLMLWYKGVSSTKGCVTIRDGNLQGKQNCMCRKEYLLLAGFWGSLGSTITYETIQSIVWCTEWDIAMHCALGCLTQITKRKWDYFPEHCKQNAILSVTSNPKRSYLENILTKLGYLASF